MRSLRWGCILHREGVKLKGYNETDADITDGMRPAMRVLSPISVHPPVPKYTLIGATWLCQDPGAFHAPASLDRTTMPSHNAPPICIRDLRKRNVRSSILTRTPPEIP